MCACASDAVVCIKVRLTRIRLAHIGRCSMHTQNEKPNTCVGCGTRTQGAFNSLHQAVQQAQVEKKSATYARLMRPCAHEARDSPRQARPCTLEGGKRRTKQETHERSDSILKQGQAAHDEARACSSAPLGAQSLLEKPQTRQPFCWFFCTL